MAILRGAWQSARVVVWVAAIGSLFVLVSGCSTTHLLEGRIAGWNVWEDDYSGYLIVKRPVDYEGVPLAELIKIRLTGDTRVTVANGPTGRLRDVYSSGVLDEAFDSESEIEVALAEKGDEARGVTLKSESGPASASERLTVWPANFSTVAWKGVGVMTQRASNRVTIESPPLMWNGVWTAYELQAEVAGLGPSLGKGVTSSRIEIPETGTVVAFDLILLDGRHLIGALETTAPAETASEPGFSF